MHQTLAGAVRHCVYGLAAAHWGEDKLVCFARILLLLTLTLAGGCFQIHSILKTVPRLSLRLFPPFPLQPTSPLNKHSNAP